MSFSDKPDIYYFLFSSNFEASVSAKFTDNCNALVYSCPVIYNHLFELFLIV